MATRTPRPALSLSLQWADARHRALLPRHSVVRCIRAALQQDAEITVRVVGLEEGRALNRDFRGKDKATNVLTFDYASSPVVVADIILCAEVVQSEARAASKPLLEHYAHLIVHGALHAQGQDHERDEDAARMQQCESRILLGLGFSDPWARRARRSRKNAPAKAGA